MPLVEIVSEPDLRSAAEASAYLRELRGILRTVEASDGKMEEGGLRCDVNISVRPKGATEYGTKTEIKNLNSFRFVEKAIEYEVARQIETLEAGGRIAQETHLWDPVREETRPMRSKEFANDYRYFPEPDLPPLCVTGEWIEEIKSSMPELPAEKRARFVRDLGLTDYEAAVLTEEPKVATQFERFVLEMGIPPKIAAKHVINEGLRWPELIDSAVAPVSGVVLEMLDKNQISANAANDTFAELISAANSNPHVLTDVTYVQKILSGKLQVSDEGAIAVACEQVLAAEPAKVAEYRSGRDKLYGFFVGQVMKAMGGKANPKVVNEILKAKLAG